MRGGIFYGLSRWAQITLFLLFKPTDGKEGISYARQQRSLPYLFIADEMEKGMNTTGDSLARCSLSDRYCRSFHKLFTVAH